MNASQQESRINRRNFTCIPVTHTYAQGQAPYGRLKNFWPRITELTEPSLRATTLVLSQSGVSARKPLAHGAQEFILALPRDSLPKRGVPCPFPVGDH